MYEHDDRVVMTLDAGGTNFVFSAIRGCATVVVPICLPAVPDDLDRCLSVLVGGFRKVKDALTEEPVAISFAFPGPADYEHGVICLISLLSVVEWLWDLFWKKGSEFLFLSIMMVICLPMAKHWWGPYRRLTVNLKQPGTPSVIKICWVSRWVPALEQEW
jgi:hypothetical protein